MMNDSIVGLYSAPWQQQMILQFLVLGVDYYVEFLLEYLE